MKLILDQARKQLDQNLPFVLYKKPDENSINGLFQNNDILFEVTNFEEKGFVFASFDGSQAYIIPSNQSLEITTIFQKKDITITDIKDVDANEVEKVKFKSLISKGIQAIENNQFKKVVLSRKETINLIDFQVVSGFEKLVHLYPSTFVYCFFHPKIGVWLGATPEQLLKADDFSFKTISLAGTQKDIGSTAITWHKKEQEEQQFVTDYITDILKDVGSEIIVSKPYSIRAGNIWHIKTDISGNLNANFGIQKVIKLLHPTPAVCGLPKQQSKDFILNNENYNRKFYTGFLGELNIDNKTNLFVNLRCMEIDKEQANLYMGCGITKDSVPEKEWEESVNKSMTIRKVLDNRK